MRIARWALLRLLLALVMALPPATPLFAGTGAPPVVAAPLTGLPLGLGRQSLLESVVYQGTQNGYALPTNGNGYNNGYNPTSPYFGGYIDPTSIFGAPGAVFTSGCNSIFSPPSCVLDQ